MKTSRMDLPAPLRVWMLLFLYAAELSASLWLAYDLRFDFDLDPQSQHERLIVLQWFVPTQLILLAWFRQLKPLLGYFSTPDLAPMFHALTIGVFAAFAVWVGWGSPYAPPRSVIVIDCVFAMVGLTGVRLALRTYRESLTSSRLSNRNGRRRVAIIGAGDAGAVLARELFLKPGFGLNPIAFFDDDKRKWRSRVHDISVVGPPEKLLDQSAKLDIEEAIIAMPSAPAKRVREIVQILRQARVQCKTIPSLDQLALGQVRVSQLRNVEVQDLLGRKHVELETESIRSVLQNQVVLVTGAGGSIGSELCRQIATYQPANLLLLDRSEPAVFQIEQELIGLGHGQIITPLVGDILDLGRMREILSSYRPHVIFHAAAHKHVPMMEHQPSESIKNNSIGTALLADLALDFGVRRFTLISTDKAINPTSVMGATKRFAELYIQSLYAAYPDRTKFMAVRFGNVLGSSGSVIPLFQKQIADGGPVRVTHPEMTRYFMTIPEASMLVLQSASQGAGGEIFVLDMGKPIKILDLARQMIELSGLKPDEDIEIEFIGVRPGEKLFEETTHYGENFFPTAHPEIRRFISQPPRLEETRKTLHALQTSLHDTEADELKLLLHDAIPEYSPWLNMTGRSPGPVRTANGEGDRFLLNDCRSATDASCVK
jgi:FlaA1/EpsC-like NDP-sugar epimerase